MAVTEEWLNKVVRHVTTRGHDLGPADTQSLVAEVRRLRAAIETVLADAESQHPGGWGPDVTMVAVLKKALNG